MRVYQGETLSALLKYVISALVLVIAGAAILTVSPLIGGMLLVIAVSFPLLLAGKLLLDSGRSYSPVLMKRFIAPLPVEVALSALTYDLGISSLGVFAATGASLALFFFLLFVSLRYTGSGLLERGQKPEPSRWLHRTSNALLFLAVYFAFFLTGDFYYFGYPFLFAGIGIIPFSIDPLLSLSRNRQVKELSVWIRDSSTSYITGFFVLGLAYSILEIPKPYQANEFILFFLLMGTVVLIMYAFWRGYSIGTGKIETLYNTIYMKHRFTPKVISETESDLFANSVKEFVVHGRKPDLLIALSHMLGSAGTSLEDTEAILARLAGYGGLGESAVNNAFTRRSIQNEVSQRLDMINSVAVVIKKRLEANA